MSSQYILSSLNKCIILSSDKSPEKTLVDVPEGRSFSSLRISGKAPDADPEISRLSSLSINPAEPRVQKNETSGRKRKERSIHQLDKKDFQAARDGIQSALIGSPLNSKISQSSEKLSNCQPLKRRRHNTIGRSSLSPFSLDGSSND